MPAALKHEEDGGTETRRQKGVWHVVGMKNFDGLF